MCARSYRSSFFSVFVCYGKAGYEKQITLPNSEEAEDLESKVVVPKHVDHMLPLSESMLSSSNVGLIGDFALFMSRKFRIGWAPYWSLANPGDSFVMSKVKEAATDVFIERHESLPGKIYLFISFLKNLFCYSTYICNFQSVGFLVWFLNM